MAERMPQVIALLCDTARVDPKTVVGVSLSWHEGEVAEVRLRLQPQDDEFQFVIGPDVDTERAPR